MSGEKNHKSGRKKGKKSEKKGKQVSRSSLLKILKRGSHEEPSIKGGFVLGGTQRGKKLGPFNGNLGLGEPQLRSLGFQKGRGPGTGPQISQPPTRGIIEKNRETCSLREITNFGGGD